MNSSIADRRIFLPMLVVLGAAILALGYRDGAAIASCAGLPQAPSDGIADCATPTAELGLGAGQLAAPGDMASISPSVTASPDPLAGLRLSLLRGSSLPQLTAAPLRLPPSTGSFRWPAAGPITQAFGVPELGVGAPHAGVDIGQESGSPIRAAGSGRVTFSGGDPCCGLGYWVELNHGDRYSTRYGHMMRPPVVLAGDYVSQGQVIGFSGNTGFSTGPHVHFEVRVDGIPVDPLRILPRR